MTTTSVSSTTDQALIWALGQTIDIHTQQGWQAQLELEFVDRGDKTVLKHRKQSGPLAIQRPLYPEGGTCHTYLLHPPGGVVGGDSLNIQVKSRGGAQVLVTTPGATKFYRSAAKYAHQRQVLHVDSQSRLEWLPQENIFFPNAHTRLDSQIHLEKGAQFLGWEMHCFGRPALNEGFDQGHLIGKTEIFLDGERILSEGLNLNGDDNFMKDKGMLSFPMLGTLYITSEDENLFLLVQDLLQQIQQQPHKSQFLIAVSQIEHLIVIRALAHWSEDLLSSLQQVWQLVRQQWTTQPPQPPRIWAT